MFAGSLQFSLVSGHSQFPRPLSRQREREQLEAKPTDGTQVHHSRYSENGGKHKAKEKDFRPPRYQMLLCPKILLSLSTTHHTKYLNKPALGTDVPNVNRQTTLEAPKKINDDLHLEPSVDVIIGFT